MTYIKKIITVLIVMFGALTAGAQVGSSVVTAQGAFTLNTGDVLTLRAEVVSCGQGQLPLYNGLPISLTPNQTFLAPFTANSSQVVTFTVPGNDKIMCGNQTYTMYAITWLDNGFPIAPTATYRFADATAYTLSQQVPISFIPPVLSNSAGALCPASTPIFMGFSSTYQIQCAAAVSNLSAALPITGGTLTGPLFYSQANNSFVAGSPVYPTIQSAITAAGGSGQVVIPPSYGGSDNFTANASGIRIEDQRPISAANTPINVVYAAQYGAKCNGATNDTAAINAALAALYSYNLPLTLKKNMTVQLPQGSCLITAPLELGVYASLVGQDASTYVVCDYAAWVGTDYNCIEVNANSQVTQGAANGPRRIGGFSLIGITNSTIPNSTGISIINSANITSSSYTLVNLSIDHLQIADFDTLIYAEDFSNSQISWVSGAGSRIGFNFNGNVTNIQVNNTDIFDGSLGHTSTTGTTYGVILQPNSKYNNGSQVCGSNLYCGPQGVSFYHSNILSYDTLVNQVQCISCSFTYGAYDQAAGGPAGVGYAFQIGAAGIGDGLLIEGNQIGTLNGADPLFYSVANDSGLFIVNNYFFVDAGIANTGTIGVLLAGTGAMNQVKLNANTFTGMTTGISLQQDLNYSTINGNSGTGITSHLIDLSGAASLVHAATVIRDNTDSDGITVVNEGSATGYRIEFNQSPAQYLGTQVGAVAGCTISAGAVGNQCNTTLMWPFTFFNTGYNVFSCVVEGATGNNAVTVANIFATSISVNEVALSTTATGGGVITCSANHP